MRVRPTHGIRVTGKSGVSEWTRSIWMVGIWVDKAAEVCLGGLEYPGGSGLG